MTNEVRGVPAQNAPGRRPVAGVAVGIAILALVALPMAGSVILASIGFTGCVGQCSEPEPLLGALWGGIVLLLLTLPVLAGLITARVLTAWGWKIALAASALTAGLLLGPRILN